MAPSLSNLNHLDDNERQVRVVIQYLSDTDWDDYPSPQLPSIESLKEDGAVGSTAHNIVAEDTQHVPLPEDEVHFLWFYELEGRLVGEVIFNVATTMGFALYTLAQQGMLSISPTMIPVRGRSRARIIGAAFVPNPALVGLWIESFSERFATEFAGRDGIEAFSKKVAKRTELAGARCSFSAPVIKNDHESFKDSTDGIVPLKREQIIEENRLAWERMMLDTEGAPKDKMTLSTKKDNKAHGKDESDKEKSKESTAAAKGAAKKEGFSADGGSEASGSDSGTPPSGSGDDSGDSSAPTPAAASAPTGSDGATETFSVEWQEEVLQRPAMKKVLESKVFKGAHDFYERKTAGTLGEDTGLTLMAITKTLDAVGASGTGSGERHAGSAEAFSAVTTRLGDLLDKVTSNGEVVIKLSKAVEDLQSAMKAAEARAPPPSVFRGGLRLTPGGGLHLTRDASEVETFSMADGKLVSVRKAPRQESSAVGAGQRMSRRDRVMNSVVGK